MIEIFMAIPMILAIYVAIRISKLEKYCMSQWEDQSRLNQQIHSDLIALEQWRQRNDEGF